VLVFSNKPSRTGPGSGYGGDYAVLIKLALSGSYLGWGTITVAGDEPGFVVVPGELDERSSELFDRIEGSRPQ
jgi:hypothetical protein